MAFVDYNARFLIPTQLERDRDNPLSLSIYNGASQAAPSSGTVSVYDATGTAIVSGAAISVVGSNATYTVLSTALTSLSLGAGWRVEWTLVMPDTYTHLFVNDAVLCRVRYGPQTTDQDLIDLHPDLASYLPSGETSWQKQRDRAHANVYAMLEGKGRAPYKVLSRSALKPIELYEALSIICMALSGTGAADNKWTQLAEHYRARAQQAFDSANFLYDESDDGAAGTVARTPARSSLWLTSTGHRRAGLAWRP